jgi:hypothetical protein
MVATIVIDREKLKMYAKHYGLPFKAAELLVRQMMKEAIITLGDPPIRPNIVQMH